MPAVKPEDRITQSDSELHVGLELPTHTARQIYNWARNQKWPEGTDLEQPREYHITLMYTPEGHDEHKDAWWIEHLEQAEVKTIGVKAFQAQDKGYAYVLVVDSEDVKQKAEEMQGRAEWAGLPITHFEGGYTPHITVAYGPSSRLTGISVPNFQFDVGPSSVSSPSPKKEASKAPEPPNYRHHTKPGEKCGTCKMFDHAKGVCWGFGNKKVSAEATCDNWFPEHKRSAYDPQHVETLDHLSLTNVAANLHYKFAEGGMDAQAATDYAKRMLKLIGYPPDEITVQAALQAWQQMYPEDRVLPNGGMAQELPNGGNQPTVPTESWGYGTKTSDYYHLAPTTERDRIRQHGLQPATPMYSERWVDPDQDPETSPVSDQHQGIYVFKDPVDSADYTGEPMDRWRIPASQIKEMRQDQWGQGKQYYITHPVSAELDLPYEANDDAWQVVQPNWRKEPGAFWNSPERNPQWGIGKPDRVIGKVAAVNIPPEPGTVPIPEGNIRLYHYTGADPEQVRQQGLLMSQAKGETYGEPNQIWASARPPSLDNHNVVEFSVPRDDPRWGIGKYEPYINYAHPEGDSRNDPNFDYGQYLHARNAHVTFNGDISPEEIHAVHEPWHQHYRYLMQNYSTPDTDPNQFDWALKDDPQGLGRGVQAWKNTLWPKQAKFSWQSELWDRPDGTKSRVAMPLAEPLEPHLTLYHGTTNRALDIARQKGVIAPWHPRDVANEVAAHYNLDPDEFYHHPYFEFSRGRAKEDDPYLYMTTNPRVAQSYAQSRSEQLTDALNTAHRMLQPDMYNNAAVEGFSGSADQYHRQVLNKSRDDFRDQYFQTQNIQPQVVALNVPHSAIPQQQQAALQYELADPQVSGNTYRIPGPIPLDWVSSEKFGHASGELCYSLPEAFSRIGGLPKYAEMVPIDAIKHLKEFDRRPENDPGVDPEYWQALKGHIAKNGFEDPLTLSYNPDTGKGYLGEGNHRLGVAEELGMPDVPLMVYRTTQDDERMQPMHEPGTYRMENERGHSQFPQYAKPSEIGLPVTGPYTPATSDWYRDQYPERFSRKYRAGDSNPDPPLARAALPDWRSPEGWFRSRSQGTARPYVPYQYEIRDPSYATRLAEISEGRKPLYHWTDASQIHDWMDESHTGPGHTFLTETGEDPNANWNPDIPHFDNPVRLTIDPEYLDHNLLDQTYEGWLGNHLYQGPIPPDAVVDVKSFKQPESWQEDFSTVPSQVNNPEDHWGIGTDPSKRVHDVQFSNDWAWHQ